MAYVRSCYIQIWNRTNADIDISVNQTARPDCFLAMLTLGQIIYQTFVLFY